MSNVNPEDINAFTGMLGKLNSIQEGRKVVDTEAGKADRLAKNDMTAILSVFAEKSGTTSALTITPEVLAESKKSIEEKVDNPYAVGMAQAMKSTGDKPPLEKSTITKAHDIAKAIEKEETNEDSLSDIKKQLTDYLQDIKDATPVDDKELSKKNDKDKLGPVIKTIKTDDGKEIKIHGNEDDGFRLKVNEKVHSAKFKSFDEAQMACETYVAKRKTATENQDYVEEK